MNNKIIPEGSKDYYGKGALLRDFILNNISTIYSTYGFDALYTPIIEYAKVFNGHHGEEEKFLFKLEDRNKNEYVLKYDSTVPLARVVSMYDDIKLPYKRYQLQQSYRYDENGFYREFIQCDGDVVGSNQLINDSEFINIAYEGLSKLGFDNFTIRINHRKIIQAIADIANINDKKGILEIQRAIHYADKQQKNGVEEIKSELLKRNIDEKVIQIIIDVVNISNSNLSLENILKETKKYFKDNKYANEGINDLEKIINYLPKKIKGKCKIDFTLSRGADYYTGFILEGKINNIELDAVLGGGRYDNLVSEFNDKSIPAVGMAFDMENLMLAMKKLGLDKRAYNSVPKKILLYVNDTQAKEAIPVLNRLREKYNTSLIFDTDINNEDLYDYCINSNFSLIAIINKNNDLEFINLRELKQECNKIKTKKL